MSTLEKLFVQIFDRKNWIVDQLNQQKDLYDQYLASTLLINGIRPPSWLWNAGFEAGSSDLKELKKEDLISGLLFPPPRSNVPSSSIGCNTFYNRPIAAANNGLLSDHFFSETCASNKYFDVGERSTVVPKCPLNATNLEVECTLNCVPELDQTITSPQHQMDSRMSETYFDPVQSLARIQRSRSRQKALELRNSATEKSKKRPRKESCATVYTGRITRSRTSSEQPCHVKELLESATRKICSADKPLHLLQMLSCDDRDDDLHNPLDTQVIVERSTSGQKDLEINPENHPTKGDTTNEHSGITVRSQTPQPEINSAKGLVIPDNSSRVLVGRVTHSRSASMNKTPEHASPFNLMKELDTQVLLHEESSAAGIVGTDLVSDAPVDRHSICSSSKQEGFDGNTFVEDVEDSRLNETVVLSLQKERQDQSPQRRVTSLEFVGSLIKVPISSDPQHANPFNIMESDTQVLVHEETSATGILGAELVSDAPVDHHSICSISKQEGASMGANLNFFLSRPPSDGNTYVEPKQLIFDDVEDCMLNETFGLSLEKERRDRSPVMRTSFESIGSLMKVPISSDLHDKSVASVDKPLLEKDQRMEVDSKEKKLKVSLAHEEERFENVGREQAVCEISLTSAGNTSKLCSLSSRKGPFESHEGTVADRSPESNKISMQVSIESLSKITMSDDIHEKCSSYPDECLLKKDQSMEVVDTEEELKAYSGTHAEERLEFVGMDKTECNLLHHISSTSQTSNVTAPSSREGPFYTSDVVVDRSPGSITLSNQAPIESEKNVTSSNYIHERCASSIDAERLERDGEEDWKVFPNVPPDHESLESFEMGKIGFHIYPSSYTGRTSNVSPLSSRKETPNLDEYVIADTSPEGDKIIKRVSSTSNHLNAQKDSKIFPEDSKLDLNACSAPEESLTQLKKPDMLLEAPETGSSYAFATNSGKSSVLSQIVTQDISQIHDAGKSLYVVGPTSHEKNVGCPKSNDYSSTKNSVQSAKTISNVWENSWPQHKRRKIEGQSGKGFITSPRFRRVKPHQHEDNTCRNLKSAEAGLGTDLEFQHFPVPCNVEDFQSSVIESPVVEMSQNTKHLMIESFQYSAKLQTCEGELGRKLGTEEANIPLGFVQAHVLSSLGSSGKKQEDSQSCIEDVVGLGDPTSVAFDEKGLSNSQGEQNFMYLESTLNPGQMGSVEGDMQEKNSNLGELLYSHYDGLDHTDADQTMPELERFSISAPTEFIMSCIGGDTINFNELDLPSTTIERISVLEQLCRSSSMGTPLPHPSEYKHMDHNTWPSCNPMGAEIIPYLPGRSYSDCMPSSSCQSNCDAWSPYTPPVGKLCHNIISLSAGQCSKKQQSTNPELTPIHEDSASSSEENENLSKVVDQFQEGTSAIKKNSSTCRKPLFDITNNNPLELFSETENVYERGSLVDSANADLNFLGSQMGAKKKSIDGYGTEKRYKNKDKENQSLSLGGNGIGKPIKSPQSRFNKAKSSRSTMEKKGSQSFVEKGCKGTNIVSNIKSFVSFVQQKHSSAAMPTGRTRDHVKVKALEVAQAAKRQEEKKKNDREMKKEALNLERARRDKEKARQKELNQKQKEEEAKKKEAIAAERKRLREEEEEKKKERKRMCIEEERRQQKEQKRKLHAEKEEKELRYKTADEKERKRKGCPDEEIKHQNPKKVKDSDECTKKMETQTRTTTKVSASDTKKASIVHEDCVVLTESHDIEKVLRNLGKKNEDVVSVTGGIQEQAYDISPYKSSDDEEDEDLPNGKAFPSWSRPACICCLRALNVMVVCDFGHSLVKWVTKNTLGLGTGLYTVFALSHTSHWVVRDRGPADPLLISESQKETSGGCGGGGLCRGAEGCYSCVDDVICSAVDVVAAAATVVVAAAATVAL
ncbi:hypothetical protein BVC80_1663g12 [Macleaya cordata]|uniref:Inner centromere protein ARK-binding domain-containing protein n=1 Tax=Macleaya cordata TaxID=56857 RepID=A0A200RBS1_MACCD|nr:hypothetical protein BVC80_1663g12 [Macleaya cordata]